MSEAQGIATLWARRKIQDLEENRFDRQTAQKIDAQILQTALDHHLVSRLTSLVAVDITPSRDVTDPLITQNVPTMLPKGWDFGKLTGLDLSRSTVHASPPPAASGNSQKGLTSPGQSLQLPSTASPHIFLLWLGAILTFFGRFNWLKRRRKIRPSTQMAQRLNATAKSSKDA